MLPRLPRLLLQLLRALFLRRYPRRLFRGEAHLILLSLRGVELAIVTAQRLPALADEARDLGKGALPVLRHHQAARRDDVERVRREGLLRAGTLLLLCFLLQDLRGSALAGGHGLRGALLRLRRRRRHRATLLVDLALLRVALAIDSREVVVLLQPRAVRRAEGGPLRSDEARDVAEGVGRLLRPLRDRPLLLDEVRVRRAHLLRHALRGPPPTPLRRRHRRSDATAIDPLLLLAIVPRAVRHGEL